MNNRDLTVIVGVLAVGAIAISMYVMGQNRARDEAAAKYVAIAQQELAKAQAEMLVP